MCIERYAPSGLSLHAFARSGAGFAGSFEPGPPRYAEYANLEWNACKRLVAVFDGEVDAIPTVCGRSAADPIIETRMFEVNYKTDRAGDMLESDVDVAPSDPRIRARYPAFIAHLAKKGLVPYRVVIRNQIGAGITPEVGLLVQHASPQDTVSVYLPSAATLATFEEHARVEGFQPFHYDDVAVIWRRRADKRIVMRASLSDADFATADAQETAAGLTLFDLDEEPGGWRAIWST